MQMLEHISEDLFRKHLDAIDTLSHTFPAGYLGEEPKKWKYTRASYSEKETHALEYVGDYGKDLGCESHFDAVGNLHVTRKGRGDKKIIIGSHCDTVPGGGNYDGAAGVVAGLVILEALERAKAELDFDVTVMGIRAEESAWFGTTYIGSKAAFGILPEDVLYNIRKAEAGIRRDEGGTLEENMRQLGYDPSYIKNRTPTVNAEDVLLYIEPHIEQGPVLLDLGIPVGIVTTIRGSWRHKNITLIGEYNHSGTTPRELRKDAVFAFNEIGSKVERMWGEYLSENHDLVVTFGSVHTDRFEDSITKVPGRLHSTLDIRSADPETLSRFYGDFLKVAQKVCGERGIGLELDELMKTDHAVMDEKSVAGLEKAANQLEIPCIRMPSGAGHDAAIFSRVVPACMVFFRHNGKSHTPEEDFDYDAGVQGARVIAKYLMDLGS